MSNRTAVITSAVVAGCISIFSIVSTPIGSAHAADDECLSAPKATTPAGGHWYYRIEKGTKRKCWYLGDAGGKVNKSADAAPSSVAEQDSPPPKKPLQKSVANARAELTAGTPDEDSSLAESTWPPLPPAASESIRNDNQTAAIQPVQDQQKQQGWNIAPRWPEPKSVASAGEQTTATAPEPAQSTPALTPDRLVMAAVTPAPETVPVAATQPAAAADIANENFSIRIVLSVLVCVLALGAIIGPMIFRSFRPRKDERDTVQRRPIWDMNTSGGMMGHDNRRRAMSQPYVDPLPEPRVLDEAVDEIEHLLSRASKRSAA